MSTDLNMEYQEVKFGEIAKHISKRVEPSETTLEIYVGLEHLDPDSLKITRHGVPSDVAGQKLLVKKGQIIFGKRRAYQRKVAVADWDCICSAHAMVLEAIPGKILPEFLPFFMQSNQFMERAVDISEGSLSPTIKWKILEQQNFKIPSLQTQSEIVQILTALNKSIVINQEAILRLSKAKKIYIESFKAKHSNVLKIKEIFKNIDSMRKPVKSADRLNNQGDIPYYGASGVIDYVNDYIFDEPLMLLSEDGANLVERKTPIAFKVTGKSFVNNHAHVYRPIHSKDIDYVVEIIEYMDISRYLTGTAQPKLNKAKADNMEIIYPEEEYRDDFLKFINKCNRAQQLLDDKAKQYLSIRINILN
ncbi:restriction endonuclease subunit S [Acinetobacter variabilis]|uniref:restriction endonuclease subunit S n=1 Tax=Acinetobacter variabilis TaxID=70346 RepID=UPI002899E3CD|nr:restriction endonuclease subunit S [Acinetobacter variabilis]